jgi:glucose/arabinose dehydrogenase/PKD repeat protein
MSGALGIVPGRRKRRLGPLAVLVVAVAAPACMPQPPAPGGAFVEEVVFSGLTQPTAVRFAKDGRVFVAEKSGLLKVFDNLTDTTPTVFADLRTQVYNFWDRGLLGLALDPQFPANPWVYVSYTRDAVIGGAAPRWGSPGGTSDPCPTPPGATQDGCVASGRLSRLEASGNVMVGQEQVLIDDWCQQYPSHSIGDLAFGPDGALYASSGEGAAFGGTTDYGQWGDPRNPCGDAPVPVGGTQTIPSAEGGALRSQDLRSPNDPTTLDGTIIRVDPATGAGLPDNPLASSPDSNARRIIAYGLRNPFRFTIRPGTNELWIGDVGWGAWEEINWLVSPTDATVENFGWPCYEGVGRQPSWDAAGLTLCENLYAQGPGAVTPPSFTYHHQVRVDPNDNCASSDSVSGVAFMPTSSVSYPASYRGALFFSDYSRKCIWVAPAGANGQPDFSQRRLVRNAADPVDLQLGPDNNIYYVDHGGTVRRIRYDAPPQAVISADPQSGPVPLTVQFDGTGSFDPGGGAITYAWDLDGDGAFDDSTSPTPSYTYTASQDYTVRLQVTDSRGTSGQAAVVISAANTPPTAVIDTPAVGTTWAVGDTIGFSGHATDTEQGTLPDSALTWKLVLHHCPSTCHAHNIHTFSSTSTGTFVAPDHDYPSHLELQLTATDARGLKNTTSVQLNPRTTTLTLESQPSGLTLTAGATNQAAPFTLTVIEGSTLSVSAQSPQTLDGTNYVFNSWSDGGAQSHSIVVAAPVTLTATYQAQGP